MAFFDDISRKISKVSQNAVQKGKDINDIVKINSAISTEEKNINSLCQQIGNLYVSKHADDCEAELKPFVDAVIKSQKAIEEYRQKVMSIKGVVCCEQCGAEIANNAAFCSSCGAPAPKPQVNNVVVCSVCGQPLENGVMFCANCGTSTAPIPTPEAAPIVPTPQLQAAATLCANCGNAVPVGTLFCTSCGAALAQQPAPEAEQPIVEPQPANICTNCSAPLAEGALFCTFCGTRVAQTNIQAPAQNLCPNCGNEVADGMIFCTNCGFKVR